MKIAYVFPNFMAPSEVFSLVEINALVSKGVDVSVFSLRDSYKKDYVSNKNVINESVDVCFYKFSIVSFITDFHLIATLLFQVVRNSGSIPEALKSIFYLPAIARIAREIEKKDYDIVHLFWGHYPSYVLIALDLLGSKVKKSMFLGAYDLVSDIQVIKRGLQLSDYIFTHSEANVSAISQLTKKHVNVVYRGVNDNDVVLFNDKRERIFIYAGRLLNKKGVYIVLNVFNEIHKKEPESRLLFCGSGAESEQLKLKVDALGLSDSVEFMGHVTQDRLFSLFSRSSFLIFPSFSQNERLPNVIKEAMLRGCIPISSESIGIHELISDGIDGFIIDFHSSSMMDKIFSCISQSSEEIEVCRKSAYVKIKNKFLVDKLAEHKLNIYKGDNEKNISSDI